MTSIADIQKKFLEKLENKFKGSITRAKLMRIFSDFDRDGDGFITLAEFRQSIEMSGNALSPLETEFLFHFWDTMAEQQPAQGAIEIAVAVADLVASVPQYGGGFRSGDEGFKAKGAKGNLPSQEGGIFGGGSYEADAANVPMDSYRPAAAPVAPGAAPSMEVPVSRPKGNQSSIAGGIFGSEGAAQAAPTSNRSNNKSNQSSIPGGIFGEGPAISAPAPKKFNSNQSSIPGGIFG